MSESYEDQRAEFIREILDTATSDGHLNREEAATLIRSVVSPTKEGLPDAIASVIVWAQITRVRAALLDVILTLNGALEVTPSGEDPDDISVRLRPDIKVEVDPSLVEPTRREYGEIHAGRDGGKT